MPRTYKGMHIYECEYANGEHGGKWTVQTYHSTGNPYADELCPHFANLADARLGINEMVAYQAQLRRETKQRTPRSPRDYRD